MTFEFWREVFFWIAQDSSSMFRHEEMHPYEVTNRVGTCNALPLLKNWKWALPCRLDNKCIEVDTRYGRQNSPLIQRIAGLLDNAGNELSELCGLVSPEHVISVGWSSQSIFAREQQQLQWYLSARAGTGRRS